MKTQSTTCTNFNSFPNYFYPYACNKKIPDDLALEFYECWKNNFDLLKFNFNNFVHKDFNLNNLMFLPSRTKHLKCGVLDFQNAFIGFKYFIRQKVFASLDRNQLIRVQ